MTLEEIKKDLEQSNQPLVAFIDSLTPEAQKTLEDFLSASENSEISELSLKCAEFYRDKRLDQFLLIESLSKLWEELESMRSLFPDEEEMLAASSKSTPLFTESERKVLQSYLKTGTERQRSKAFSILVNRGFFPSVTGGC